MSHVPHYGYTQRVTPLIVMERHAKRSMMELKLANLQFANQMRSYTSVMETKLVHFLQASAGRLLVSM